MTELNELIYVGAKLVCEKTGIPSKSTKKKIKTRMGNSTGNEDKKKNPRKPAKMIKQRKDDGICWNKNEKATQEKTTIQLEEINQKVLAKEGRLRTYRQRVKQCRQNRIFQNNERKFCQQLEEDDTKTYQQPDAKEIERFWTKIWQLKT